MNAPSIRSTFSLLVAVLALALLAGCSGGSSSDASRSAVVVGKLLAGPAKSALPMAPLAHEPLGVHVESHPEIKTVVGEDGSFTLRGLPEGGFTLVFTHGETIVGRLTFQQVAPNQQITISVQLVDDEVVLVDEDRRGIGHAGVELQGLVENVIVLNATGDSRFVIAGRSVIARPGVTAIRQGNTAKSVEDVTVGRQVHVKGTTVEGSTDVLAYEIKLQSPEDTSGSGSGGSMTICHIPPGNPSKAKTITIGASAWPAHEAHGDSEGACPAK